jgi:hypothetical protein
MAALIYPFLALSTVGFAVIFVVHLASLFGVAYLFAHSIRYLAYGVFVVFVPAIFVMNQLTQDFKQKDTWRAALRGCPRWMRRVVWVMFGYAWAGSLALPFLYGGGMDSDANKARSMSGILMVFYLIPTAVLYSATQAKRFDESRRCLNGHPVSPSAKFCEECGTRVAPPRLNTGCVSGRSGKHRK